MNTDAIDEIVGLFAIYVKDTKPDKSLSEGCNALNAYCSILDKITGIIDNTKTFVDYLHLMKDIIDATKTYLERELLALIKMFSLCMIKKYYTEEHDYSIIFGADLIREWETYFQKSLGVCKDRSMIIMEPFNKMLISKFKTKIDFWLEHTKKCLEVEYRNCVEHFTEPYLTELTTLPNNGRHSTLCSCCCCLT